MYDFKYINENKILTDFKLITPYPQIFIHFIQFFNNMPYFLLKK